MSPPFKQLASDGAIRATVEWPSDPTRWREYSPNKGKHFPEPRCRMCCNQKSLGMPIIVNRGTPARACRQAPGSGTYDDCQRLASTDHPYGPCDPHAALQSLVHLLQRIRRLFEAGTAGDDVPRHRRARQAWYDHRHHLRRRTAVAPRSRPDRGARPQDKEHRRA